MHRMMRSDDGVLISNGRSGVRLNRAGPPNELGYPTLIDVRAGPFSGSVRDDTTGCYGTFRAQLAKLYDSLSGNAKLGSYEGFELVLIGDGRGAIGVRVEVVGEHMPPIHLTFEFAIDQTYLPAIIQQVDREFPPPYRSGLVQ
jgi:hypothetical protein